MSVLFYTTETFPPDEPTKPIHCCSHMNCDNKFVSELCKCYYCKQPLLCTKCGCCQNCLLDGREFPWPYPLND